MGVDPVPLFLWRVAMASLLTYRPSDVTVTVAGIHTVTGYAEDTFINIVNNTRPVQTQRSMDGVIERLYTPHEGYTVTLTLAQSSLSNNVLGTIANIDAATRMGKFPLTIKDTSGQTTFFAIDAWIDRTPDVSFGQDMATRAWVFG